MVSLLRRRVAGPNLCLLLIDLNHEQNKKKIQQELLLNIRKIKECKLKLLFCTTAVEQKKKKLPCQAVWLSNWVFNSDCV